MKYTIIQWISFFYIYAFCGWIWESCYVSARQKKWVNRGFLRGPVVPIYGFGATILLAVSMPFAGNYLLTWAAGVVGATTLEYVTGWAMERLFKIKYWDYTGEKFNLHGYICLKASIAWGFFTIIMVNILHPPIEQAVETGIGQAGNIVIVCVISVFFVIDTILSARDAFDMAKVLEAMERIRGELEEVQVQLALLKMETTDKVDELKAKAVNIKGINARSKKYSAEKTAEIKETMAAKLEKIKELNLRRDELNGRKEKIFKGIRLGQKGLLRGNPTATAKKFEESLRELKEKFKK